MRFAWLVAAACACGHPTSGTEPVAPRVSRTVPRLPPPPVLDLDAPDAPYRAAMAVQIQPAWAQFLEDCRLRLPADHPLNDFMLAATAELAIDTSGHVAVVALASSGNADFDRAVRQIVADAAPMPRPPLGLWSDDDRVHVRWVFARDRRQAGPATAQVIEHSLPVADVIGRLLGADDLTRAAQRLRREPADLLVTALMTQSLRDTLVGSDGTIRRAAVEAIAEAGITALASDVRDLLDETGDRDLRLAALHAVARLGDRAVTSTLVDSLRADIRKDRVLALAEVEALVALGASRDVADLISVELAAGPPVNPVPIHALRFVRIAELDGKVVHWSETGDVRVRAAACVALEHVGERLARSAITKGLRDRDASVRAACLDATHDATHLARVQELLGDRDATVRARAIGAYGRLDGEYAAAVDRLAALASDLDPDVRAAAWRARPHASAAELDRAIRDPASQVRRAVVAHVTDDAVLQRLADSDEDGEVRTRALVRLVNRRGRTASADALLERFAAAAPGSAERVRVALAWHLSR